MLIKNKKKPIANIATQPKEPELIDWNPNQDSKDYSKEAETLLAHEIEATWARVNSEIIQAQEEAQKQSGRIIQQAQTEAQNLISKAEQQAQNITGEISLLKSQIEAERDELKQITEEEKQKGFHQGLEEAKPYINDLIYILQNFNKVEKNLIESIKPQITSIGFDVAKLIIGESINQSLINEQVKKSIEKIIDTKGIIQIYINEADNTNIGSIKSSLEEILDENTKVLFKINNEISPGSCQINTQAGRLDASFETQLKVIKVILEKHFGHKIDEIEKKSIEMGSQKDEKNIKLNQAFKVNEPSDIDLEMIEDEEESGNLMDLNLDDDINNLVEEIMVDKKNTPNKIEDDEDIIEVDWEDSEDEELEDEDSSEEFADEELVEAEEEFDEIDEEFDEDDEEEEESDPRYPEY